MVSPSRTPTTWPEKSAAIVGRLCGKRIMARDVTVLRAMRLTHMVTSALGSSLALAACSFVAITYKFWYFCRSGRDSYSAIPGIEWRKLLDCRRFYPHRKFFRIVAWWRGDCFITGAPGVAPRPRISVLTPCGRMEHHGTLASSRARRWHHGPSRLRQSDAGCSSVRPHQRIGRRRRVTPSGRHATRRASRPARINTECAHHSRFTRHPPRAGCPRLDRLLPTESTTIRRACRRRPGAARSPTSVVRRDAGVSERHGSAPGAGTLGAAAERRDRSGDFRTPG
jgi:hypothetical protein